MAVPEDPLKYISKHTFKTLTESVELEEDPVTKQCKIKKTQQTEKIEITRDCFELAKTRDCDIVYPPNFGAGGGTREGPVLCSACQDPIWATRAAQIQCNGSLPCFKRHEMPNPCVGQCEDWRGPCNVCDDGPKAHTQDDTRIGNLLMDELSKYCDLKMQGMSDKLKIPLARIRIKQVPINVTIKCEGTVTFYDNRLTVIKTITKELKGFNQIPKKELSFDVKAIVLSAITDWTPVNTSRNIDVVIPGGKGAIVWLNPGNNSPSYRMSMICPKMKKISWIYGFDNFAPRIKPRREGLGEFICFDVREPLPISQLLPQGIMPLSTLVSKCRQTSAVSSWPPKYIDIPIPPGATPEQIQALIDNAGGRDKPLEKFCTEAETTALLIKASIREAKAAYEAAKAEFLDTKMLDGACAMAFSIPAPTLEITFLTKQN